MSKATAQSPIGTLVSAIIMSLFLVSCDGSSHSLGKEYKDGGGAQPGLDAHTNAGGDLGGREATGGSRGNGGASGVGGSTAAGAGGAVGAGGASMETGVGGARTGGKTGTGGARETGGKTGTGGAMGTGGKTGTGGTGGGGGTTGSVCGTVRGIPCAAGEFCELTVGTCLTLGAAGECAKLPQDCPLLESPAYVCGCDGKTYVSDCERQAAAVSKASDGPCPAGTGGAGGGTGGSSGTGGSTGSDAGLASTYSGCQYIGGFDRAVVAKFDPQAEICVVLVLVSPSTQDAGLEMTLTQGWGVEATGLWPSATDDCVQRLAAASATRATSATGSVSVNFSSSTIDVDAVLFFPATDGGAARSIDLKAQGVDIGRVC